MTQLLPSVSDDALTEIQAKEPTAFRITYRHPSTGEVFGDVVLRKPKRSEVHRFRDVAKRGGDTSFIVPACLLAPDAATWAAVTEQELSGLPATVEDDLMKASGVLAQGDLGKR